MDINVSITDVEQTDPVRIKEERDILLKAIFEFGVNSGALNPHVPVAAPHLLMLLEEAADFIGSKTKMSAEFTPLP